MKRIIRSSRKTSLLTQMKKYLGNAGNVVIYGKHQLVTERALIAQDALNAPKKRRHKSELKPELKSRAVLLLHILICWRTGITRKILMFHQNSLPRAVGEKCGGCVISVVINGKP